MKTKSPYYAVPEEDIERFVRENFPLSRAQWDWVRAQRKLHNPRPPRLRWWSKLKDIKLWLT